MTERDYDHRWAEIIRNYGDRRTVAGEFVRECDHIFRLMRERVEYYEKENQSLIKMERSAVDSVANWREDSLNRKIERLEKENVALRADVAKYKHVSLELERGDGLHLLKMAAKGPLTISHVEELAYKSRLAGGVDDTVMSIAETARYPDKITTITVDLPVLDNDVLALGAKKPVEPVEETDSWSDLDWLGKGFVMAPWIIRICVVVLVIIAIEAVV